MSDRETPVRHADASGDETRTQPPAAEPPDPLAETHSHRAETPPDLPARPPFILGPYHVVRQLGRGGMGAVYLAVHSKLKKSVAVKVLPPARVRHAEAVARFHREMEAVGALAHPNVVGATDAGEADGLHYLVMEYVDGFDLSTLVRLHGPLSVADAAEVIRQAACGLQYIHESGRVHRDVKPSNLMLSVAGEVKILDLGLALLRGQGPGDEELTGAGEVMGTADYMAPEQWLDSHWVDIRADVYSLGCTLYKLLAGRAPFSDASNGPPFSKRELHARSAVPRIDSRRDLPAPLQAALLRMLAKAPADRMAAPAEVAEAMRPFTAGCDLARLTADARRRAGSPTPAPPSRPRGSDAGTRALPSVPTRRRVRWPVVVAVGLVLAAALAALTAFVFLPPSLQPQPTPPTPPPPIPAPLVAPFPLVWPGDARDSDWGWNAERCELRVTCNDEGLIRLGEPAGPDYAFEVDFRQIQWGGAGVFFGHHAETLAGKPGCVFQAITLTPTPIDGDLNALSLKWQEHHRRADGSAALSAEAVVALPEHQAGDQRLSVVVADGKLRRLAWNGADVLPALRVLPVPAPQLLPSGANCAGNWGAYASHTTAFFHNPHPFSPGDP